MTPNVRLTRSQRKAVSALVAERTIGDAASASGVSERSIYRWLADDHGFRAALASAESVALDNACRRLSQLVDKAVNTLETVMDDPAANDYARLRAADLALSHLVKLREFSEIEQRLSHLEVLVYGDGKQPAYSFGRRNGKPI